MHSCKDDRRQKPSSGFTMVELAITLTIISIVAAGFVINTIQASATKSQSITMKRMEAIRLELTKYYMTHYRIPCPAPGDARLDTSDYGIEDASSTTGAVFEGDCNAGGAEILDNVTAAMGGVPVKQLNLPDEYGLDGWGRKILYAVDQDYTETATTHGTPVLVLKNNDIATNPTIDDYPVLLISTGKHGNGSFSATGSTVANRLSSISANTNEEENIHMSSGFNITFSYREFLPDSSSSTDRFDQIVYPIALE